MLLIREQMFNLDYKYSIKKMILNRLEPGTQCKVLSTGEKGILKQIYFYPTKFELEFPDGRI